MTVGGQVMAADLHKAICAVAWAAILSAGSAFGAPLRNVGAVRPPAFADDPSPVLWGNVRSGLTLAQVRKLVPLGHAPSEPDRLLSGEAPTLLETAGTLLGKPSRARFYFTDQGKLLAVVETVKDQALSFDDVLNFVKDVSAKQGHEHACNLSREVAIGGCEWIGKSLTVTMSSIVFPERMRVPTFSAGELTLNYMSTAYYRSMYPLH
jgi:hypothetical protein